MMVTPGGIKDRARMGKGGKGWGNIHAVKAGQEGTTVESEGPSRGVAEPVGIQMRGKGGREEGSGGRISRDSGCGREEAIHQGVRGEVEVTHKPRGDQGVKEGGKGGREERGAVGGGRTGPIGID